MEFKGVTPGVPPYWDWSPTPSGLWSLPQETARMPRADSLEIYSARRIPQGLTRQSPSSFTPPPTNPAFIPYAGGRRIPLGIPGAGEYRIELDRVR